MTTSGLTIAGPKVWEVSGEYDEFDAIEALAVLLPEDAALHFEGVAIFPDVAAIYAMHPFCAPEAIRRDTIQPEPRIYDCTLDVIPRILRFRGREEYRPPQICDHLHSYRNGVVLVSAYDFGDLPILVADDLPRDGVQEFASRIGCKLRETTISS